MIRRDSARLGVLLGALLSACTSEPVDPSGDAGNTGGSNSSGGAPTGGTTTGGTATGGKATGGSPTGGTATGGTTGGKAAGGTPTGGKATGGTASGGMPTGGKATGGTPTGGKATGGTATGGGASTCIGASLLASLGQDTVLVGGAMTDATAGQAPFDGRYLYLSGGLFDGTTPCASCATNCTSAGTSCSNAVGCGWWGCWQWDQDPPGQYVTSFVGVNEQATWQGAARRQIPMFTYYEELQTSGLAEGTAQVAALNDAAFLTRYLADWRFVLQKVGSHVALLHIEPDFWGYVEQLNADPHAVPAKVTTANPTDCAGYENSATGVAKCMIHMVRLYAPNARVGLHASAWGTKIDVLNNGSTSLDVLAEARKISTFLTALGAKDGDFVVADFSDRDAAYYESIGRDTWWDATNATLPSFHQAFTWVKAVAENTTLPVIIWQIPVGNMSLDNTTDHWRDNRLDYLFTHMDEVVEAHIVGLFFGGGMGGMTTPETDGGNFVSRTISYRSAGGRKVCP